MENILSRVFFEIYFRFVQLTSSNLFIADIKSSQETFMIVYGVEQEESYRKWLRDCIKKDFHRELLKRFSLTWAQTYSNKISQQ